MYVEICFFKDGFFDRRSNPFHSRTANDIFNDAKIKYLTDEYEVIISLRDENHMLIKSAGNLTHISIKSSGGKKVKKQPAKKISGLKERAIQLSTKRK